MMKDQNCAYCAGGELLDAFGIVICELSVSTLILFKEQSKPGRCIGIHVGMGWAWAPIVGTCKKRGDSR